MSGAIYIAGPTASGKSEVALLVAEQVDGEIISVDSMQVYRGMDIGTAKPTLRERARVPHHMIDVAEPSECFDAARFLALAQNAETEISRRGRTPVFCGGTGLYFNALISGIGDGPSANLTLRAELEAVPLPVLLEELARTDPETFRVIDRANSRRVIRALEVIRTTGRPYSAQRSRWKDASRPGLWIGLGRDRTELIQRIDHRVDSMFASGLVEETQMLLRCGLEQNRTAMQAIGYRQVVEFLRGDRDLRSTIDVIKQKTRQYAKRQMTWFRRQLKLQWIDVQRDCASTETAAAIVDLHRRT